MEESRRHASVVSRDGIGSYGRCGFDCIACGKASGACHTCSAWGKERGRQEADGTRPDAGDGDGFNNN